MDGMDGCHGPNNLVFQPEHVGVPLTPPLLRDLWQTFDLGGRRSWLRLKNWRRCTAAFWRSSMTKRLSLRRTFCHQIVFFSIFSQQTITDLVQIKSHLTKCSQFSSTEGLYYHQQALWRYGTIVLF